MADISRESVGLEMPPVIPVWPDRVEELQNDAIRTSEPLPNRCHQKAPIAMSKRKMSSEITVESTRRRTIPRQEIAKSGADRVKGF